MEVFVVLVAAASIVAVLSRRLVVGAVLSVAIGLDFRLSFLVGTMVAATDPAAILAVMAQSGATRRLTTLVEAESLFNDGTGVVIFSIALGALAAPIGPAGVAWQLVTAFVISTAIGVAIGFAASFVLKGLDDHLVELAISLVAAY